LEKIVKKRSSPIKKTPVALQITVAIAFITGFFFVRSYFGAILLSALIAFLFNPVYKRLLKKTGRQGVSISATLVIAGLSIVLPLVFIIGVSVAQIGSIVTDYQNGSLNVGPTDIQQVVDNGANRIDQIISALPGGSEVHIDKQKTANQIKDAIIAGLNFLATSLAGIGSAILGFISTFILSIFLISSMLRYQKELIDLIKRLSPFENRLSDLYLYRASIMTTGMVKGQFVIATTQGFASALSLWLVGVRYFWFLFLILSFLSFIPLGAGIITIPIGLIFILTGNVWQGIYIILWHMLVVSFIDNILRPKLVKKDARLNTALMMLAVFSGIAVFGAAGVVYGPVIMILIVTTLYIYSQYNAAQKRVDYPTAD
jgi:predicted PurR-regulated permease PerM